MRKTKFGLYVIVLGVVALVITTGLILVYSRVHAPSRDDENVLSATDTRNTVYLVVENQDGSSSEFSTEYQDGDSLLDLMYRLHNQDNGFVFKVENSDYGPFVSGVNGYEASSARREVWKLNVNGMAVEEGIDTFAVSAGDVLTLALEHY